ncbi:MAG: PH domain-containing protein [Verrucomicrobium sp.]|nr:PH domain-containing protein [Verrucomicrobium sp.]
MLGDPDFSKIIDEKEEVLWTGAPTALPFLLQGVPFLLIGLAWGAFDYFGFIRHMSGGTGAMAGAAIPFFALHLFPCWGSIGYMAWLCLVVGNVRYAFTNRRLLIRSGVFGIDFKALDYDRIQELDVTVNPVEKILGVGSIRAFSGQTNAKGVPVYDRFIGIEDPYGVYKRIKQVTVDIKTDWNYPNALRPPANQGYSTRYEPPAGS